MASLHINENGTLWLSRYHKKTVHASYSNLIIEMRTVRPKKDYPLMMAIRSQLSKSTGTESEQFNCFYGTTHKRSQDIPSIDNGYLYNTSYCKADNS